MDRLDSVLRETRISAAVFDPETFGLVASFARGFVEALGVRGQDADDLAQHVLTGLREGPLDASGDVTLHAALRHRLHLAVLHWWRGERRRRAATARAAAALGGPGTPAHDPATPLVTAEEKARVRRALEALPDTEAQALRLHYFSDLSAEEIRRQLGYRSVDVLYVRLSQARARLREILAGGNPR